MGVPSFYRWLARKYHNTVVDCVEEKTRQDGGQTITVNTAEPNPNGQEFDNLYLDMNGIIHPCTHPDPSLPQPKDEADMMNNICAVLDRLFSIVRPRKLIYLAVDGVAPRAKMNQQRARRFRAAQEAEEQATVEAKIRAELEASGKPVPPIKQSNFDSNVITPGTEFMKKVSDTLMKYTTEKLLNDPGWKGIEVMISDASVPGEGEHKIMHYIRTQRAQPNYNPNLKHVICGLDADLIMLGLATHEPHFSILREEVLNMNQAPDACHKCKKRGHKAFECEEEPAPVPEGGLPYQFLHLNVLREHLELNYRKALGDLPFYDLERLIDDFIFLCFLVGNDFLPHLPTLEIREGAIDVLMGLYCKILPTMGDYMTNGNGDVDFTKVRMLINEVAFLEDSILQKRKRRARDDAERERRNKERMREGRKPGFGFSEDQPIKSGFGQNNTFNRAAAQALKTSFVPQGAEPGKRKRERDGDDDQQDTSPAKKQKGSANGASKSHGDDDEEEEPEDNVRLGEAGYRERYYHYKFNVDIETDLTFVEQLCRDYAEGLAWVFKYYYVGCSSWKWFFPHHYAPFAKDLAMFIHKFSFTFSLGTPFKPFEQLMGVLPAKSHKALPEVYHKYMGVGVGSFKSPILHLYPTEFKIDMNGKKLAHQAVILLPFLNEDELLSTIQPLEQKLSPAEKLRNTHGDHILVVNTSHPIAAQLALASSSATPEVLNPTQGGMFGTISKLGPLQKANFGPVLAKAGDQIIAAVFKDPSIPPDYAYAGKLLPGLIPPDPVLPTAHLRSGEYGTGQNSAAIRMVNSSLGDNQHKPNYNQQQYGYAFNVGQNNAGFIPRGRGGGHHGGGHRGGHGHQGGGGDYSNVPPPPGRGGYRGGFSDSRGHYSNNPSGGRGGNDNYNSSSRGGYNNRGGGYNNRGGYNDRGRGGYNNNRDGYDNNRSGGFHDNSSRGGYNNRGGHDNRGSGFHDNSSKGGRGGYDNNHNNQQQARPAFAANYNPFAGRR